MSEDDLDECLEIADDLESARIKELKYAIKEVLPEVIIKRVDFGALNLVSGKIKEYNFHYSFDSFTAYIDITSNDGLFEEDEVSYWTAQIEFVKPFSDQVFIETMTELLKNLKVSPFPYEFHYSAVKIDYFEDAVELNFHETETLDIKVGLGSTPEEAWHAARYDTEYYLFPREKVNYLTSEEIMEFEKPFDTPINKDLRNNKTIPTFEMRIE